MFPWLDLTLINTVHLVMQFRQNAPMLHLKMSQKPASLFSYDRLWWRKQGRSLTFVFSLLTWRIPKWSTQVRVDGSCVMRSCAGFKPSKAPGVFLPLPSSSNTRSPCPPATNFRLSPFSCCFLWRTSSVGKLHRKAALSKINTKRMSVLM